MKVSFEFFDADFENICDLSKTELADRIILFANKLKNGSDDVANLEHIQSVINFMAADISEELL